MRARSLAATMVTVLGLGLIYLPASAQLFEPAIQHQLPYPNIVSALGAADFNGDGKLDLLAVDNALACYGGNRIYVLLGAGDGTFQRSSMPVLDGPDRLAIGDFNSDTRPDILLGATHCIEGTSIRYTIAEFLVGNGDGSFAAPYAFPTGEDRLSAVGDFNADGHLDFVDGFVFLGPGPTFTKTPYYLPVSVLAADFNRDDKLDWVGIVPGATADSVIIYFGAGDGNVASALEYPLGFKARDLLVSDFNSDQIQDVLVNISDADRFGILLGNGDGTLAAMTTNAVGPGIHTYAAADFNLDGNTDLALTQPPVGGISSAVVVLLGNGDATFRDPIVHPAGSPQRLISADWNSDHRPDLAFMDYGTGAVNILFNASGPGLRPDGSASSTIVAGQTATYNLMIGGAGLDGTATFSCTGAPRGAACIVPSSMVYSALSATSFSVTVTTTAHGTAAAWPRFHFLALPVFALLLGGSVRSRARHWRFAGFVLMLLLLISCGGGTAAPPPADTGTPAGTYQLQVTATTAAQTQSVPLTLVVR